MSFVNCLVKYAEDTYKRKYNSLRNGHYSPEQMAEISKFRDAETLDIVKELVQRRRDSLREYRNLEAKIPELEQQLKNASRDYHDYVVNTYLPKLEEAKKLEPGYARDEAIRDAKSRLQYEGRVLINGAKDKLSQAKEVELPLLKRNFEAANSEANKSVVRKIYDKMNRQAAGRANDAVNNSFTLEAKQMVGKNPWMKNYVLDMFAGDKTHGRLNSALAAIYQMGGRARNMFAGMGQLGGRAAGGVGNLIKNLASKIHR